MSIVETVKRICADAAKALPGAEIIAPLPVWDGNRGAMGVQIKAPRQMGPMACIVTAGFVLEPAALAHEHLIRAAANAAVACMTKDIQVQIKPVKARERVA